MGTKLAHKPPYTMFSVNFKLSNEEMNRLEMVRFNLSLWDALRIKRYSKIDYEYHLIIEMNSFFFFFSFAFKHSKHIILWNASLNKVRMADERFDFHFHFHFHISHTAHLFVLVDRCTLYITLDSAVRALTYVKR